MEVRPSLPNMLQNHLQLVYRGIIEQAGVSVPFVQRDNNGSICALYTTEEQNKIFTFFNASTISGKNGYLSDRYDQIMNFELRLPDTSNTKVRSRAVWSLAVIAFAETNFPPFLGERAATLSEVSELCGFPQKKSTIVHNAIHSAIQWDNLIQVTERTDKKPIVKIGPSNTIPFDPPTQQKGKKTRTPAIRISFA